MRFAVVSFLVCLLGMTTLSFAAEPSLTVHITNKNDYCFILPKQKESIGSAERPGGMKAYCTKPAQGQGYLPTSFFKNGGPHIKSGQGQGAWKQITGCIDPNKARVLVPNDGGGQVDSNGGSDGRGNPANSACAGYASYVSIIEPGSNQICLRCCQNPADCPVNRDTSGCAAIIPGTYC